MITSKVKILLLLTIFLFFPFLLFSKEVFAGGAVSFDERAEVELWNESASSRFYAVHVYLGPSFHCQNVPVTFKFEDPRQGDYIQVPSGQQPEIIASPSARSINGRTVYDCATYAKVSSGDKSSRYLYVEILMEDGSTYTSSKVSLDFETDNPVDRSHDPITTPWDDVTPDKFLLGITSQNYIDCPKRQVQLSWNQVDGTNTYTIFSKIAGAEDFHSLVTTSNTSEKIILNSCQDYYVHVKGCSSPDNCIFSGELYISRMPLSSGNVVSKAVSGIGDFFKNLSSKIFRNK